MIHTAEVNEDNEAKVLSSFCHHYLPFVFGVNTSVCPFKIMMQYHAFPGKSMPTTLQDALCKQSIIFSEELW